MKSGKSKFRPIDWETVSSTRTDRMMLWLTVLLTLVGLVCMFSASYANAIYYEGDGFYYIKKQAFFAAMGFVAMMVISYIPYKWLHKLAWPVFLLGYALLWATLLFPPTNNSRRWIYVGGFSFQPSEAMKFCIILLFAHLISMHPEKMDTFAIGFCRYGVYLVLVCIPMVLQPHISGTVLILLIGFAVMWCGGTKFKHFLIGGAVGLGAATPLLLFVPKFKYALQRITSMGGGDTSSDMYQTYQSMIAIGSGGLFGLGLGNSRQKQMYVPFAQNDFIFAIVCEELGFVGAVFIIILFIMLILRGINIAMNSRDKFGALLVSGIMAQIALQVSLNIAVVSGAVPNTGIALPFFSQGGTALFILLCELGVVLSVARYTGAENGSGE